MRLSNLFTKTSRDYPADETSKNAQLLIRAGFVHKTMPGVYAMLPLGLRVLRKVENIVRKHMDKTGAQETLLNMLQPKELWVKADNRWETLDILFRLKSQSDNEYALAQSNEEQITNIAKGYVNSWKDLPEYDKNPAIAALAVYQIQTKFRDEIRSKAGLMRGREFRMKDLYDFHQTEASQNAFYEVMKQAYLDLYHEMGLEAYAVRASGGAFSKFSHEFQVLTDAGEDWTVIWSDELKDNLEVSKGKPINTHKESLGEKLYRENLLDNVKTVDQHAQATTLTPDRIIKSVLFTTLEDKPRFVAVAIRGDLEVNEELVIQELDCGIKVADDAELESLGSMRGRFTPITEVAQKYTKSIVWLFDESIRDAAGMASSFYTQVDVDRDLVQPSNWAYLGLVQEGFVRDDNSEIIAKKICRSSEVGNIFKLGRKWTKEESIGIAYTDKENQVQRPLMGCYGIGTTRCMGALAEINSDEKGLKWPKSVTPFMTHLVVSINEKDEESVKTQIQSLADQIYSGEFVLSDENNDFKLIKSPLKVADQVLYDDRAGLNMGAKLTDAELIGCPYILIISKRSLENGGVELKVRATGESQILKI